MRTVRVGDSELEVSAIGLGCNNFGPMIGEGLDERASRAVVEAALDAGITFFDTAERYADGISEQYLGKALNGRREQVVIATKFGGHRGTQTGTASFINAAIDGSLKRLGTDYVDLYFYHRPDRITPISETLHALGDLVRSGKVRHVGCSNFDARMLREADDAARASGTARFVAVQNEYNLLHRAAEEDVLPLCRELGIGFVPYYPLASGLLTGKYRRGEPAPEGTRMAISSGALDDAPFDTIDKLTETARAAGHTLLELALAGLASEPGVSGVIAGATSPDQVRANARAADWRLDADELARLPQP